MDYGPSRRRSVSYTHLDVYKRQHRFRSIAVVTLSAVMVAALTGITYATNVVYIYDGDSMTKYYTTDPTLSAEEILEEQGIALTADDEIVYHGFTDDSNVTSLMIRRAFEVDITAVSYTHLLCDYAGFSSLSSRTVCGRRRLC